MLQKFIAYLETPFILVGESHVVYSWHYKAHRMGQWCNRSIVFLRIPKENLKFLLNCGLWGVCAPLAETSKVRSGFMSRPAISPSLASASSTCDVKSCGSQGLLPAPPPLSQASAGFLGQSLLKRVLSSYAKMVAVILWARRVKKEEKSLFIWSVCFLFLF